MKCKINHLELYQTLVNLRSLARYSDNKVYLSFSKDGLKVSAGSPSITFARKTIPLQDYEGNPLDAGVDYAKLRSFLEYAHSNEFAFVSGEKRLTIKIGQSKLVLSVEQLRHGPEADVEVIAPLTYEDVKLLASASECATKFGNMQGLYIAFEGSSITASSCDGYRMSYAWIESAVPLEKARLFIPSNVAGVVSSMADKNSRIAIGMSGRLVAFTVNDWIITSVQVNGIDEYPMMHIYELVQGVDISSAEVKMSKLLDSLKALGAVKYKTREAKEVNRVNFQFINDQLFLSARDGPDEMMFPIDSSGDDMMFGLSGTFVREGIGMFGYLDDTSYARFSMIDVDNLPLNHSLIKVTTDGVSLVYIMAVQLEV